MADAGPSDYGMEIVNTLYKNHAMAIPHRPYAMLSGEFRPTSHEAHLGNDPWIHAGENALAKHQPPCLEYEDENVGGNNHEIWTGLYEDFRKRRLMSVAWRFDAGVSKFDALLN
ncbi:hypothetical protein BDV19DRAFT_384384 [Aspergillus venezuelensis]